MKLPSQTLYHLTFLALLILALTAPLTTALPSPPPREANNQPRQAAITACPQIHILAARETTAPPEFGSTQALIDLLLQTFSSPNTTTDTTTTTNTTNTTNITNTDPDTDDTTELEPEPEPGLATISITVEAIDYPAAGANPAEYAASVSAGIDAVVRQTGAFVERCPGSLVVMHGYSQGAQIMDDAFCGGPDVPSLNSTGRLVSDAVARNTAAIILMGNPRHVDGLPFNVGSAIAGGFAARPADFECPEFEDRIQAYCDAPDPFCSDGDDEAVHQGYGQVFGQEALQFVLSKIGV